MERGSTVIGRDRVPSSAKIREGFLEGTNVFAVRGDPVGIQTIEHVLALVALQLGLGNGDAIHLSPYLSMLLAGTPATRACAGRSETITDPAAATTSAPIEMPGTTLQPMPRKARDPIFTLPAKPVCGAMCPASPMSP